MNNLQLSNGTALVVVAHPDDETIWMGGTILTNHQLKWTIFSLCRYDDPDRAPKFAKVCNSYNALSLISDLEDESIMNLTDSLSEIEKRVVQNLPARSFRYIFTHGESGEYGHIRHKGIYRVINNMILAGTLTCEECYHFSYRLDPNLKYCIPENRVKYRTRLPNVIFRKKRNIISKMYGFTKYSFEYRSCNQMETFSKLRLHT